MTELERRVVAALDSLPDVEGYEPGFLISDDRATAEVTPHTDEPVESVEEATYEGLLRAAQAQGLVMVDPGVFVLPKFQRIGKALGAVNLMDIDTSQPR
jgi:hypothetical protein